MQFKSTGDRIITLNDFRNWFRIENKYKTYADLHKRIIKPAIDALNAKTKLSIKYTQIKKRSVFIPYPFHLMKPKNKSSKGK